MAGELVRHLVVIEIDDADNANPHDMRDSRWYQVLGEGFVDEAFRLAGFQVRGTLNEPSAAGVD